MVFCLVGVDSYNGWRSGECQTRKRLLCRQGPKHAGVSSGALAGQLHLERSGLFAHPLTRGTPGAILEELSASEERPRSHLLDSTRPGVWRWSNRESPRCSWGGKSDDGVITSNKGAWNVYSAVLPQAAHVHRGLTGFLSLVGSTAGLQQCPPPHHNSLSMHVCSIAVLSIGRRRIPASSFYEIMFTRLQLRCWTHPQICYKFLRL